MVLGVEELRGLKGFQYTATLLDLERLRFVGTCCLRLLRVYICEIFPIAGQRKQNNLAGFSFIDFMVFFFTYKLQKTLQTCLLLTE